jgi:hypothetical protein
VTLLTLLILLTLLRFGAVRHANLHAALLERPEEKGGTGTALYSITDVFLLNTPDTPTTGLLLPPPIAPLPPSAPEPGEMTGEVVDTKTNAAVVVDTYIPLMDTLPSVDPGPRISLATLKVFKWPSEPSAGISNGQNKQQARHASSVLEGVLVSYLYNPVSYGGLAGKTLQMHHFLPALEAIGRQLHDLSFLVTPRRPADTDHTNHNNHINNTTYKPVVRNGAEGRGSLGSDSDRDSGDDSEAPELDAFDVRLREVLEDVGRANESDSVYPTTAPLHMAITYRLLSMFESIGSLL